MAINQPPHQPQVKNNAKHNVLACPDIPPCRVENNEHNVI
jgi:hypothetical protein